MKTNRFKYLEKLVLAVIVAAIAGCYPDDDLNVPVQEPNVNLDSEIDQYIEENFTRKYGMAIRYRFVDQYVQPTQRVTPPRLEVVRPMLDFIEDFWIEPYLEIDNGEDFFMQHVPAEIVFMGGLIFNGDGTVTLGTADAGAQITFTNVNAVDPEDDEWRSLQLQTVYHEFAHIVHQRYKLPGAFENISPTGYTSAGSWFTLTDEEALRRGFTSPYGTSSPNEDFAEVVAFYLFDPEFDEKFMEDESNCEDADCEGRNEGRERIRQKLSSITQHYQKVVDIDLDEIRNEIQVRLSEFE